ncbi:MAG: DUF3108 domain-containing protein [Gammaproteobacteria bacterium]
MVLACAGASALAAEHVALKRPFDLPPSADLAYSIKAKQKGITLAGDGVVNWRATDDKYSVSTLARASILGKILENRSEGVVDSYGLAPTSWHEKRFRKDPNTTTFDRAAKRITFSVGEKSFPILGGEQDRASAQWQMVAVARGAPAKMVAGSEWKFFVAGRRDAEQWTFKVVGREKIQTGIGLVETVHLVKSPPADYPDQRLDLWLAPSKEWYPVRLKLSEDEDEEFVEQTLERVTPFSAK